MFIEEVCVNCSILFLVDFLTYKNYKNKLDELKKSSVNNIEVFVVYNFSQKTIEKLENKINETYNLVVGIGEFYTLKFAQYFAIKSNIMYAFVNLNILKSELFCKYNQNFSLINCYYPPHFVLIEDISLCKQQIFDLYCNVFKFAYIIIEYNLQNENENLFNFLKEYKIILNELIEKNILKSVVALGLILNKYNIEFYLNKQNFSSEFSEFINSHILGLSYKCIFKVLNENNLYFSRYYKKDNSVINSYENFDFNFYKFYLISKKKNILKILKNYEVLFENFYNKLKNLSIEKYYNITKNFNVKKILNKLSSDASGSLFLKKMQFFELFNFF